MNSEKQCDQCEQFVDHLPRKYKGKRYCGSCYHYHFTKRVCRECGAVKRIHRDDKTCLCRHCYSKVTPCFRCGRIGRPVGQINSYGLLCNSCANVFRPHGRCSLCKREGPVSIGKKFNLDQPICDSCRLRLTPKCPRCGNRRKLYPTRKGQSLCYRCKNQIKHYCIACKRLITDRNKTLCRSCQTMRRNQHLKDLNCARFSSPNSERIFKEFVVWLTDEVGHERAVMMQNRFAEFFLSLQNAPKNWLTDVAFLSQLDGGCLRSSSLPRRFLKTAGIHFDGCRLKQAMELRTINKNLEQIRSLCEEPLRPVIDKFFDKRLADNRSGQMKLLTIRLETSSVTALLEYAQEVGSITAALDVLAVEVPGLKASLSAFLNYLNQYAGKSLQFPQTNQEMRLVHLIKLHLQKSFSEKQLREYLGLCLALLHDVPVTNTKQLAFKKSGQSYIVTHNRQKFWVPLASLTSLN